MGQMPGPRDEGIERLAEHLEVTLARAVDVRVQVEQALEPGRAAAAVPADEEKLVVAIGHNPGKDQLFTTDERLAMIQGLVADMIAREPDDASVRVLAYTGLTVDFAISLNATALLRGIRNLSDLQYEVQQAVTNREVANLETAFVVAGQSFAYTSSSLIKQITALGKDLSVLNAMVPPSVVAMLEAKRRDGHPLLDRLRDTHDPSNAD